MSVTTGKVRLSFCHVWEPQAPLNGQGEPKYSVTILIPKTDTATLNAIYSEMAQAEQIGVASKWGGMKPPVVKTPIYDGDGVRPSGEPFGEECHGCMVMTANSSNQPQVVDLQIQPILNRAEVYSGCYARVSINFFPYAQAGNKGIGCGLNSVQKIEDGEALSGGVTAQEAFGGSNAYPGAPGIPTPGTPNAYGLPTQAPGMMPGQPQYSAPAAQPQAQMQPNYQAPQTPQYGMPAPAPQMQQSYQMPQTPQAIDPITGQPIISGGVMGI